MAAPVACLTFELVSVRVESLEEEGNTNVELRICSEVSLVVAAANQTHTHCLHATRSRMRQSESRPLAQCVRAVMGLEPIWPQSGRGKVFELWPRAERCDQDLSH